MGPARAVKKPLLIIASCTDRKRLPAPMALRLRRYREATLAARFESWWEAVCESRSAALPAQTLYLGDHWAVVRDLPAVAEIAGWKAQIWVASAGYGLVPTAAPLHPYAATFSRGHRDAVARATTPNGRADARTWWSLLGSVGGPVKRAPRRVSDLLNENPRAHVLLVGSEAYIRALEEDIREVLHQLRGRDALMVVTGVGVNLSPELKEACIPSVAELAHHLGGSLVALHARLARRILQDAPRTGLEASEVGKAVRRLIQQSPRRALFNREKMTDREVTNFIGRSLKQDAMAPHTVLLRRLRDSGNACEQKRFRDLFGQVRRNA